MSHTIEHQEEVRFSARFGEHEGTIDLPHSHGGQGRGMAPPQLVIATLDGCAGANVADHGDSQGIDDQGMRLNVDWGWDDRPRRISSVDIRIELPDQALTPAQLQGMLDTVRPCTLHHTLAQRPPFNVEVVAGASTPSSPQQALAGDPCENGACGRAAH